jgi:sulfur-carrier protein
VRVHCRLYASLRKYLPAGSAGDTVTVELADGATVADALAALGIPAHHARMAVSHNQQLELRAALRDEQELGLFPPLAGGAPAR